MVSWSRAGAVLASITVGAAALVVVTAGPAAAAPESITVTTTADVVNPGDGVISLREAITTANTDGTALGTNVQLGNGSTYLLTSCGGGGNENANVGGDLDATKAEQLVLFGQSTVRQTCPGERVVDQLSATGSLALSAVVITGGTVAGDGGGVRVAGSLQMQIGAHISGNRGVHGGGAYVAGDVQMTQSSIHDNVATGTGGGLRTQGTATLGTSAVNGNRGTFGGGILAVGNISLTSSTVTQNEGTVAGGGLYALGVTVNTATVAANRSPDGANIRATDTLFSTSAIVSMGSGGADCVVNGVIASGGNNFGSDGSCGFASPNDVAVAHPMLGPLVQHFYTASRAPVRPSPVVDHDPTPCTGHTFDQEVDGRGAPCSSGAIEAQPPACTATFPDVPADHVFFESVCWLTQMGITGGFDDGLFKPAQPVTRQAMAAFLFRFAEAPAFTPPSTPTFTDVGPNHPFRREIEWLATEGIAAGYADGTFGNTNPVTRQAMATFLYRVDGSPPFTPATATFPDVPLTHVFSVPIEWLVANDIADGYDDGTFKPANAVSRQAMATFLLRMAVNDKINGL